MKPKIILLVAEIIRPGGTERVVVNLANNFFQHGHEVTIASINTKEGKSFYTIAEGVQLKHMDVTLEQNVVVRSSYGFYKTTKVILHLLKKEKLPVIILGTDPITCFALSVAQRFNSKHKYIACEHMGLAAAGKHSRLARKLLYTNLSAIVFLTEGDRAILLQNNKKLPPCVVIPNELSFFPQQYNNGESKTLLAVGKYDHQKRFDILLSIIAPILKEYPDWKLVLVGSGILADTLAEIIKTNHLESQVELVAPTPDIMPYYVNAALYLMSSAYEGFPMVLLEAKACGLPIISYDCPTGPREIIVDTEDGFLIPFNDEKVFGEKVKLLMNNEELRKSMGIFARQNVAKYSSQHIFELWTDLFNSI